MATVSRRADGLALRRAMPDRLLPTLVAAMTFLAALALAGAVGAAMLADRWAQGAASILTVQVPDGSRAAEAGSNGTRLQAVLAVLAAESAVSEARPLDHAALSRLLSPWLGSNPAGEQAIPLPDVVQVRLKPSVRMPADLASRLDRAAPGTLTEQNQDWSDRLVALTTSLQACAGLALLVVAWVAIAVVAAATRAGLGARRQAIEIVHGLGAGDGYIAGRFAGRATRLALWGGIAGTILSVPLLLMLCQLGAPFVSRTPSEAVTPFGLLGRVPLALWIGLPLLPPVAAAIGWTTAQATVRTWLRRLP